MNTTDLEYFKKKLEEEKMTLEEELGGVAQKDGSSASGWQASPGSMEVDSADENEVADKLEELEDNTAIAGQLENQLTEVKGALERMGNGTYGLCEICQKPIEKERLEANPSARISLKHSHK